MDPRAVIRERALRVEGIASVALEAGPPDADEAVLFLHGNPCSSEDWRDLVGRTGAFARAVAPDLPGFGRADRPASFAADLDAYGRWLDAAVDELGIRRAHLVLHDFGGGFGFALATRRPDLVASITLLNAGPLPGYRWHRTARLWRTPLVGEALMAAARPRVLASAMCRDNPGLPQVHARRMARDYDRGSKRTALRLYRATDPDTAVDWNRLRTLDVPVLAVLGAQDPYMQPADLDLVQRRLFPHARVERMPQAGHWPFLDDPEGAAAIVVPFLRKQSAGPGAPR